ncbi:hypothetical protein B1690_10230 [Geobacillus sp. 46C-IIa]|uniref:AtuA-related protein n=1 Tax=Geobacillus sp. 46C-IIa TaxID=1963025 RepID=UPI0009BF8122|nr:hypothetical protein [Geobacillus sp. 46C-IIa]OQP06197.1 hypothetical protein B1690_10230 [Geobacillus sp. 46C-IIa]QNU29287.1 hypothetical protein IC803_07160 [Geobacillus sp. 46C-IIa]
MPTVMLKEIAHARSGDKGNCVNIGVFANDPSIYPYLVEQMTAGRVKQFFAGLVLGKVIRYEMPNIDALNFVCYQALDGGGSSSLRVDNLGKCFGANILRFSIHLPDSLYEQIVKKER